MYKRLADATSADDLNAVKAELEDRYGTVPQQVATLLAVAELRIAARALGLTEIIATGPSVRFAPVTLPDSLQIRMARLYPKSTLKPATRTIVIPKPGSPARGAADVSDQELLEWVHGVLKAITPVTVAEKSS